MADSQEDLIFRVLMQFPDAKVPPLDTREAEAAVARLKAIVKQAQSDLAASAGAMVNSTVGPGAMPGGGGGGGGVPASPIPGYPTPATPRPTSTAGWFPPLPENAGGLYGQISATSYAQGRSFGPAGYHYPSASVGPTYYPNQGMHLAGAAGSGLPINAQRSSGHAYAAGPGFASGGSGVRWANNAPGPGNWSMGNGNWSQGPVSDPGTATVPGSLTTARGYDQAMLRENLQGLNFNAADGGLTRVTRGLSQAREAAIGLSASLVLLNKSMEKGSGWDNGYTQATAALGIGSYGLRLGQSGLNLATGAAGWGQGALAGAAASMGGRGFLGRVAAAGSRTLGSLASGAGARALGIFGGAAAVTTAAMTGWAAYHNYQNETALDVGEGLQSQMVDANERRRVLDSMANANNAAAFGGRLENAATADFKTAMAGGMSSFSLGAENRRRLEAMSFARNTARNDFSANLTGAGDEVARVNAGEQLVAILRQEQQILNQNVQKRQQEFQIQTQQVRVAQQQVEAARQLAGQAGRVSNSDWRRGMSIMRRAQGRGLNERDAEALDDLAGFGGAVDKFFEKRGQDRMDALPKEFRDKDARGRGEIAAMEAQIKQFEATQGTAVKALQDFVRLNAGAWATIENEIGAVKQELTDFISRNPNVFKGR